MPDLDFRALLHAAPDRYLILAPDAPRFTILEVSDAYLAATMTKRSEITARGLFEVFPDNPNDPSSDGTRNLRASLETVIRTRQAHTMPLQKYDIRRVGSEEFEERYWSPHNAPIPDETGGVAAIIHRVDDVTAMVRLERTARARAEELERATEKLERIAAERLAPVLLITPHVLAIPIVGDLDSNHASHVMNVLLAAIKRERPRVAILDLSAASGFDSSLSQGIWNATKAARLLGVEMMVTGVTADAAHALVSIGADFSGIETFATLADAIAHATGAGDP